MATHVSSSIQSWFEFPLDSRRSKSWSRRTPFPPSPFPPRPWPNPLAPFGPRSGVLPPAMIMAAAPCKWRHRQFENWFRMDSAVGGGVCNVDFWTVGVGEATTLRYLVGVGI